MRHRSPRGRLLAGHVEPDGRVPLPVGSAHQPDDLAGPRGLRSSGIQHLPGAATVPPERRQASARVLHRVATLHRNLRHSMCQHLARRLGNYQPVHNAQRALRSRDNARLCRPAGAAQGLAEHYRVTVRRCHRFPAGVL